MIDATHGMTQQACGKPFCENNKPALNDTHWAPTPATSGAIPTQGRPDAHFATYPDELPRRCILAGTSERGVCADCGAPVG